ACTIITLDHLNYALTLFNSIDQFGHYSYRLLIVDATEDEIDKVNIVFAQNNKAIHAFSLKDLKDKITLEICEKYKGQNDYLRWALKPCFLEFLLNNTRIQLCLYFDSDIACFESIEFLFEDLKDYNILLTPHWRTSDPYFDKFAHLEVLATANDGIYNGGFIGVNKDGIPFLEWWKKLCHFACIHSREQGLRADQKWLDQTHIWFGDWLKVSPHRGLNCAIWNWRENKRSLIDGKVLINGIWPIVFVHFTKGLLNLYKRQDPLLHFYVEKYQHDLAESTEWLALNFF